MMHALNSFVEKIPCFGLFLMWAGMGIAAAETVSYSGKVVDESGTPLPWAFIKAQGGGITVQSGADGTFSFTADISTTLYGDPKPRSPSQTPSAGNEAHAAHAAPPVRFLLTGRAATGSYVASTLLLSPRDRSGGRSSDPSHAARQTGPVQTIPGAPDPGAPESLQSLPLPMPPPPPAPLEKTAAAPFTLTVSMARHQTGSFPQAEATAKNLVLTLSPSLTDTAAYAAEKQLCLDTINAYRATLGLKAVVRSASLEAFADQGARYDSERDQAHAHFSAFSKGAIPSDAENAIPGWPLKSYKTVAKIVGEGAKMMWAEGPGGGHYENIKGSHTAVGCGIYVNPAGGVWIIHDFKYPRLSSLGAEQRANTSLPSRYFAEKNILLDPCRPPLHPFHRTPPLRFPLLPLRQKEAACTSPWPHTRYGACSPSIGKRCTASP